MKKLCVVFTMAFFLSCNNDETEKKVVVSQDVDYDNLKLRFKEKINLTDAKFSDETRIKKIISRHVGTREKGLYEKKATDNFDIKISLDSRYGTREKQFLLSFYNDLANSYDDEILDLIRKKRADVEMESFSLSFKNEIDFIFYCIEEVVNKNFRLLNKKEASIASKLQTGDFWDCITKKVSGKDLARNMVYGIATGAATGGYTGATLGTFTVPLLGTAVGGVGGAVFGAAAGAVSGVVGGYVWPAIDCLPALSKYEEKFLKDDFFREEMSDLELSEEDKRRYNNLLNTSESTVIKVIEE